MVKVVCLCYWNPENGYRLTTECPKHDGSRGWKPMNNLKVKPGFTIHHWSLGLCCVTYPGVGLLELGFLCFYLDISWKSLEFTTR